MTEENGTRIPETHEAMSKKYRGIDEYQNHRTGDEHVVVFIRAEHTTKMGS